VLDDRAPLLATESGGVTNPAWNETTRSSVNLDSGWMENSFMFKWAVVFLIIALIAGALGMTNVSRIAKRVSFILFALFFLVFLALVGLALLVGDALT
jgi:uncharacterized membrane protein YtjA (UPF0391 family)